MKQELIIVRYSEIALKAKATRKYFEKTLIKNIKNALNKKQISNRIKREWGRIYVYTNQINESVDVLKNIFGIISISSAFKTKSDMESMVQCSLSILKDKLTRDETFALRVTRDGKHGFTSQDVAVKIGDEIVKSTKAGVDLSNPDFELFIEVRDEDAYIFTEKIRGIGGLPFGTQGKVLALIDSRESILAAWYLIRRGCSVLFVATEKKYNEKLDDFTSNWNIPKDILYIENHGEKLYKELNEMALEQNCVAVVTGHTLASLSDIKLFKKYTRYPVLFPLVAMDENEINKECKGRGIKG